MTEQDLIEAAEDLGRAKVTLEMIKHAWLYLGARGEKQEAADDYRKYLAEFRRRLAEYVRAGRDGSEDFPPIPYRPVDERE